MPANTDIYHLIADQNRRKIMDLLQNGEQTVQSIVENMDITFGGVSQHLKILLDNGLVTRRRQGRNRFYRLHPQGLKTVYDWTRQYSRFWTSRMKKLGHYLDDME